MTDLRTPILARFSKAARSRHRTVSVFVTVVALVVPAVALAVVATPAAADAPFTLASGTVSVNGLDTNTGFCFAPTPSPASITVDPVAPTCGSAAVNPFVISTPYPGWSNPPITGSQWVGPEANGSDGNEGAPNFYVYQAKFNLSCATASLSGTALADNAVGVFLNSQLLAAQPDPGNHNFNTAPVSYAASSSFNVGENTVDFVVDDAGLATGLDYSFTVSPGSCQSPFTLASGTVSVGGLDTNTSFCYAPTPSPAAITVDPVYNACGNAAVHPSVVVTPFPGWLDPPIAGSQWVSPEADGSDANEGAPHFYVYDAEFSLSCPNASLSGTALGDNAVGVFLNGQLLAAQPDPGVTSHNFNVAPVNYTATSSFNVGVNVVDFVVHDLTAPASGLDYSLTVTPGSCVPGASTGPGAPAIGAAARAGAGSLSVAFRPPSTDGGDAISSYTATCTSSDGGVTRSASSAASPIVVSSLTGSATYVCTTTATNTIGTGPASDPTNAVMVAMAPDAPTIGTAAPANGSASVAFTPPANDGGAAIIGYTAACTSSNGGVSGSASSAASPIVVSPLTNGATYRCTVTAMNSLGSSVPSAASNAFVPSVPPAAPRSVSAVPGNGSATVKWVAPPSNGGSPVIGYVVTPYLGAFKLTAHTFNSAATSQVVAGLSNSTPYTFKVAAKNAAGVGPVSTASAAITVGAPTAPTAVKALPGAATPMLGSLTVSFTAGADNGAKIMKFTATCVSVDGGAAKSAVLVGAAAAPIIVTGLTTHRTYECRVAATNSRGTGPSGLSERLIVGVPAAPAAVHALKVAAGQLRVTFTPGANNGATITSYTATCNSSNGGAAKTKTGTGSPITVTGLTAGKLYTCTVKATNSRGTGLPSTASAAVVA